MCTVHFLLFFSVLQLVTWEYVLYFWDTANIVFVSLFFAVKYRCKEGKISFQYADVLPPCEI